MPVEKPEGAGLRPWTRPGWFDSVTAWLNGQLEQLDYQASGEVEQFALTDWSCIVRVATRQGVLYVKCCDPNFGHEPELTLALSQLWPTAVPRVLAINRQHAWMLMEDAGTLLSDDRERARSIDCWREVLPRYARMQIEAVEHTPFLLEHGCPDHRLENLPAILEQALAHQDMLLLGEPDGLSADEYTRLCTLVEQLPALCSKLASYSIPETLHHDDLHAGNIMVSDDDNYIFFDWAESFIAHPFYTMVIIQRYTRHAYEYSDEQLDVLRDIYLAEWTKYGSIERLREAFEHAQQLGKLCRALTWYNYICNLEPQEYQKYRDAWPAWLKVFMGSES
jgi:hypothetical protein